VVEEQKKKKQQQKVTDGLSEIHKTTEQLLRKRTEKEYTQKDKYVYDSWNLNQMKKAQLIEFLLQYNIIKKKQARQHQAKKTKKEILEKLVKESMEKFKQRDIIEENVIEVKDNEENIKKIKNWAYKHGLLQMFWVKIYLPNKRGNDEKHHPIKWPEWNRKELIKKKKSIKELEKAINKVWKRLYTRKWMHQTYEKFKEIGMPGTNAMETNKLFDKLQDIIKYYYDNELKVQSKIYDEKDLPDSLQYLANYPKNFAEPKSWYDLNFDIWQTPLSRIQITCSCRSGQQIPSCCAHSSTVLWLLFYSMNGNSHSYSKLMEQKEKDVKIKKSLVDLVAFSNYKKLRQKLLTKENKNLETWGDICICHKSYDENVIECTGCGKWYHPKCLGQEYEQIMQTNSYVAAYWHCIYCGDYCKFITGKQYINMVGPCEQEN